MCHTCCLRRVIHVTSFPWPKQRRGCRSSQRVVDRYFAHSDVLRGRTHARPSEPERSSSDLEGPIGRRERTLRDIILLRRSIVCCSCAVSNGGYACQPIFLNLTSDRRASPSAVVRPIKRAHVGPAAASPDSVRSCATRPAQARTITPTEAAFNGSFPGGHVKPSREWERMPPSIVLGDGNPAGNLRDTHNQHRALVGLVNQCSESHAGK